MTTPEQKALNEKLRKEAMDAKFARETKQTPNGKEQTEYHPKEHKVITQPDDTTTISKEFGGLLGKAAEALRNRRREPD
jgi:hypothetical protein